MHRGCPPKSATGSCVIPLVDLRGHRGHAPPGSRFFQFHAVFSKKLEYHTHFGSWRPPQENPRSATGFRYSSYAWFQHMVVGNPHIWFIHSGFPPELENLEKWEGIFQSGKSQGILNRLEKSGKITQNTRKFREFQTNIICHILVIFKCTVYHLLKWIKFSVKTEL